MSDAIQAEIDRFPWYDVASPSEEIAAEPNHAAMVIDSMSDAIRGQQLWLTRQGYDRLADIIGIVHAAEAVTTDGKQVRVQIQWLEGASEPERELVDTGKAHLCWYGSKPPGQFSRFRVEGVGVYVGSA